MLTVPIHTDGGASNLTFGIQNTELGNAGKTEMLELVKDDSSITFVNQEHSRNYLLQIQKELDGYFEKDFGLISTGLNEKNNCIVLGIFEERKDEADTQKMIGEITQKYGNAVSITIFTRHQAKTIPCRTQSLARPVRRSAHWFGKCSGRKISD